MSDCTEFCTAVSCDGCAENTGKMDYKTLAAKLRATPSGSKRALLDAAADAIEEMAFRLEGLEK